MLQIKGSKSDLVRWLSQLKAHFVGGNKGALQNVSHSSNTRTVLTARTLPLQTEVTSAMENNYKYLKNKNLSK